MANEEHLKILKQGVGRWNKWRENNLDIKPNLSGANLSFTDLSDTNLNNVDLSNAKLSFTDLRGTKRTKVRL